MKSAGAERGRQLPTRYTSPSHRRAQCAIAGLALLAANGAAAHSFGQSYTLPVPVWLYLYGAAAALVVSFAVVGYFVNAGSMAANRREFDLSRLWTPGPRTGQCLMAVLRGLSVAALLLAIITGFWGPNHAYRNINMTLFWVIFGLGFTYLTALAGDWFSVLNPFRVIAEWIEGPRSKLFAGRWRYPAWLEYWPALALYLAFIWLELFGRITPYTLSVSLSAYVAVNLAGCWLVGKQSWFERCEFLGVFLRLIAKIAPIRCAPKQPGAIAGLYLRPPFTGLLEERATPPSLLVFVLCMLSSTAFDGLHETALWVGAFWSNLYQVVLIPLYGDAPPVTFATLQKLFLAYQTGALLLSPFIYLAVYAVFICLTKAITRSALPFRELLAYFGLSLIPIAFAYHLAHYYTLLQVQGAQIPRLMSDPLGLGWNLFGTARIPINVVPDMAVVWHMQVFVIVAGHVVSVYLAHRQALKVFSDRRTVVLSQLPILLLMVGFTSLGLWILSLPHGAGMPGG